MMQPNNAAMFLFTALAPALYAAGVLADTLVGVVDWERRLELGPLVGGTVVAAPAEVGDRVTEGEVVLRIDPLPYQHRVTMAEAEVESTKVDYESARQQYQRDEELYDIGSLSTVSLQESSYALTRAESAYTLAQRRLDLARYDLDKTSLAAPFDVWIVDKRVFVGQSLSTDQTIPVSYVAVPVGRYVAEVRIPEDRGSSPPLGSELSVEVRGVRYRGKVTLPSGAGEFAATRLAVRFEDRERLLLPGTPAVVDVP